MWVVAPVLVSGDLAGMKQTRCSELLLCLQSYLTDLAQGTVRKGKTCIKHKEYMRSFQMNYLSKTLQESSGMANNIPILQMRKLRLKDEALTSDSFELESIFS